LNKESSVKQINDFVSEKTNGKIEELLLEQDIDELTRLVLINAVYFKAVWKQSFDALETFETGFDSPVAGNINTQFMNMEAKVRVLEDPANGVEILELPYADSSKSMLFILPNSSDSNISISSRIAGINLADIRRQPLVDTVVTIPKFNMKYQTYLKEKMKNLGADDVFSQSANLNGISNQPLYASEGVHQAFIEVNEEGTEAAAATAVVVGLRTARRKRQFFANRPFLFMVYDFNHNVSLFAGKVADPSNTILIQRPSPIPDSSLPVQNSQNIPQQNSQSVQESVPQTNLPIKTIKPEPSLKSCERLLRDFPNALDNYNICKKVKEDGKFLDWLRANRNLCEQSEDLFDTFNEVNCGGHWCEMARKSKSTWEEENIQMCRVVTDDKKQFCKNLDNKFKTITHLQCV